MGQLEWKPECDGGGAREVAATMRIGEGERR
jgi:hypothetical protein